MFSRISRNDRVSFNIFGHDRTHTDYSTYTNLNPRLNQYTLTDPNIITDYCLELWKVIMACEFFFHTVFMR